ncbi:MAG: hypothetical protein Q8Q12_16445, partial [bacterium]|nr:hypothetical protein [bacterium]
VAPVVAPVTDEKYLGHVLIHVKAYHLSKKGCNCIGQRTPSTYAEDVWEGAGSAGATSRIRALRKS